MAAITETRDVGSTLPLPETVRRICCIGDSITYGQGVAPRQTLAMHIARFANMAYPDQLIWVDNRGQSSGNIWHSWVPFARLAKEVRYDAAVFSICNNDSQIFESNSVRYSDGNGPGWLKDGELAPLLCRTIADFVRTAGKRDLCLVLSFYTLWDSDAPLVEGVRRECESAGLPFVDLLHYLKEESALSIAEFVASPFDGHPSGSGHNAAARRIVEVLKEHWQPPSADGISVAERLVRTCDQAVQEGWSPDEIFHWAFLVLDAKEIVARRQRAKAGSASFGDLAGARAAIEDRYRRWIADRHAAVQVRLLYERREELWTALDRAYISIRNLDEMTFVLEHFQDGPTAEELWGILDRADYFNQEKRLQKLPSDLRAQLLERAEAVMLPSAVAGGPIAAEFDKVRRDLGGALRRLVSLQPEKLQAEALDPNLKRLWQVAHYLVNTSWNYVAELARSMAETAPVSPDTSVFSTLVDVWVERDRRRPKRGGKFNLTVTMDYLEPARPRRRSMLWGGADEDAYVYRFEMPLLLLGDVGIGVPAWDDLHKRFLDGELRIARVEIANGPPDGPRTKRSFVWKPINGVKPVHWLKLDRMPVPAGAFNKTADRFSLSPRGRERILERVRKLWS